MIFSLVENMFSQSGITIFTEKYTFQQWKCFDLQENSRKYAFLLLLSTTAKSNFSGKDILFPLEDKMFPLLGKIVFLGKSMFLLVANLIPLLGKIIFTGKNKCLYYLESQFLVEKKYVVPLLGNMALLPEKVGFAIKNVCLHQWEICFYKQK